MPYDAAISLGDPPIEALLVRLLVICQTLNLPDRAGEAIFQLARCVGITAHAIEEYAEEPLRWRVRSDVQRPARH